MILNIKIIWKIRHYKKDILNRDVSYLGGHQSRYPLIFLVLPSGLEPLSFPSEGTTLSD